MKQVESIFSFFLSLLAGLFIFVGLPLLGWSIFDWRHFFENPARTAYVVIILLLQLFALGYNPQVGRHQEKRQGGVAQHKVDLLLIQLCSLAIVFLATFSDRHSLVPMHWGNPGRYAGLILVVVGFVLMQMAEKNLTKQFSIRVTLQENHQLIQSGPYKFIRHPRYLGILAFFIGISLTFQFYLALFTVLTLFFVLLWRIYAEEALLRQEFGAAWESYCAKTWRLIPFVF